MGRMAGVIITLRQNHNVLAVITTDEHGRYTFANVNAGTYTVQLTVPTGYVATRPTEWAGLVASGQSGTVRFGVRPNLPNQAPLLSALADIAFHRGQAVTIQTAATDVDDVALVLVHWAATGLGHR